MPFSVNRSMPFRAETMQLEEVNDFSQNRELRWLAAWPHVCTAPVNGSGYRDIQASEYMPPSLLNFSFESLLRYPLSSTIYRNYLHASTIAVAVYLPLIAIGQRVMRSRKPFDLRRCLAFWNLLLAVYSLAGAARLVPHVVYGHLVNPPMYFVCRNAQGHSEEQSVYFWISLFIWSKYFELLDTVFLVLRKKPVTFLHWFHHATVLLYTWHSMAHQTNTGIYFAAMNYLVHAVMYFYYFLAAIGRPPNWSLAVTVLQISQMFVGIGINVYQFYASTKFPYCDVAWRNMLAAVAMYFAYLALFMQFFIQRYCSCSRIKSKARSVKSNGESLANGNTHLATNNQNGENGKHKSD